MCRAILLFIFLSISAFPAGAQLVTFQFEGILSGYVTEFGIQRDIFDEYHGVLSYNLEEVVLESSGSNGEHKTASYNLGVISYFSVKTSIDVFESFVKDVSAFVVDNGLAEGDRIAYYSESTSMNGRIPMLIHSLSMGLIFGDYSKKALNSTLLPSIINLGEFDSMLFIYGGGSAISLPEFDLSGTVTKFELVKVSEPRSYLLFLLVFWGIYIRIFTKNNASTE